MTAASGALLALTLGVAIVDWIAVHRGHQTLEYIAKPLTMVVLLAATLALDPVDDAAKTWFIVALACSLAGDVFLMLPKDLFVPGLASFLVGHLAYIGGLLTIGVEVSGLLLGGAIIAVALPTLGGPILRAVRGGDEPALVVPVSLYIVAISAMVVSASGTLSAIAIVGALLFYASDALIAWNRFITPFEWGRLAIMVTYHLAQIGLVLSLAA